MDRDRASNGQPSLAVDALRGTAAVLTLVLRKNPARLRYRLWLVASVKFLIPFSLLVSLGGHLTRPHVAESAKPSVFRGRRVEPAFYPDCALPSLCQFHARRCYLSAPLATRSSRGRVAVRFYCRARSMVVALAAILCIDAERVGRSTRTRGSMHCDAWSRSPESRSRSLFLLSADHWSPACSASFGQYWYGRQESLNTFRAHLEAIIAHEVCHVRRRDNLSCGDPYGS